MRMVESSPIEELDGQPAGTRFFIITVFDPESGMPIRASIAVSPAQQDIFRKRCGEVGVGFEHGLPQAAAAEVMSQLWGPFRDWPEGHGVDSIDEVDRDEFIERMRSRARARAETAS